MEQKPVITFLTPRRVFVRKSYSVFCDPKHTLIIVLLHHLLSCLSNLFILYNWYLPPYALMGFVGVVIGKKFV